MQEPKTILKTELGYLEWVENLQKEIEGVRLQEKLIHPETKYLDGFLQAVELLRTRYLNDQGVHTIKTKTYP